MSTDPREFEHPIDGSGTNPTPDVIRKAQHAMMWVKLPFGGNDLMISLDANAAHAAAKLAYDAMAPIIAAQAVRDAAEHITNDYLKRALIARADAIERAE